MVMIMIVVVATDHDDGDNVLDLKFAYNVRLTS